MALLLWNNDKIQESEPYLQKELKFNPQWAELYFRLARCALDRRDLASAKNMLERHYELNPMDDMGNNNLLLMCCDIGRYDEANAYAQRMAAGGFAVPQPMLDRIASGLKETAANTGTSAR
jgi:tetratricopeptide (TPR) repeat protein